MIVGSCDDATVTIPGLLQEPGDPRVASLRVSDSGSPTGARV
jgi:hypothetical protein